MKRGLFLVVGAVSVIACSSSDSSGSSTNASCSCNVEDNGVAQALACGTTACVNGVSYMCSASANVTQGAACTTTTTTSDAGTQRDSGTNSTPGATTVACPDDLQDTLTCPTATQYCASARSTRSTGGVVTDGQCLDKPSGCNDCDCSTSDAATAFTKVGKGCSGGATVICENKNGAITVVCEK